MKHIILIFIWNLISQYSFAQIDYNGSEFQKCLSIYSVDKYPKDAAVSCENIVRAGQIELFANRSFLKCQKLADVDMYAHNAGDLCLSYAADGIIESFSDSSFMKCYDLADVDMYSHNALNLCVGFVKSNRIGLFSNSSFLECHRIRDIDMYSHNAINACMEQFSTVSVDSKISKGLTLEQVNENIQVPENTQVILTQSLEIPGNSACASVSNGEKEVKCWVCRAKKSRNDVLYQLEKVEGSEVEQKILPVESSLLSSNGKEIHFKLVRDPSDADNLDSVLCNAKKVLQIKNRNELLPIFEANGLKLIFPAAKVK